jgi:hypothetical protein
LAFFLSSEQLGPAALPIEAFFARQNATPFNSGIGVFFNTTRKGYFQIQV